MDVLNFNWACVEWVNDMDIWRTIVPVDPEKEDYTIGKG